MKHTGEVDAREFYKDQTQEALEESKERYLKLFLKCWQLRSGVIDGEMHYVIQSWDGTEVIDLTWEEYEALV